MSDDYDIYEAMTAAELYEDDRTAEFTLDAEAEAEAEAAGEADYGDEPW